MRYWNTYDAKSEIITSNQNTHKSEKNTRLSCRFKFSSLLSRDNTNSNIRIQGKYVILKCMIFHTFISYFLLGNLISYLLLIACISLILQSDIVEARAHYPVLIAMLLLIDHHLTQQSEVGGSSLCGCLNLSQLKNIFCYSKLYFLSIMLIRPSSIAPTYTSGPANVPNLLISREFLPSTQDMNLQANIFR